ncbi:MAG: phosphoglycerate dehydrogenase [Actinomycetota bacterium]
MTPFTLLVTANAFRESADTAEPPVREAGGEVLYPPRMGPLSPDELIPYLSRADAVVAATDPYTSDVLSACPRLRAVIRWGTGYDSVDLAACTAHGVVACNTPGLVVEAVADYVFATMLGLARRLPYQLDVMRRGGWEEVRGVELYRKTLGLVGFGAIGKAVARRARGFDVRLLAYDPQLSPEAIQEAGAEPADLLRVFAESDFVSIHASLTPASRGMVGEDLLRRMKPTAYFINAARGPLVDDVALVRALSEGWISGAAVDAYAEEPPRVDHPLRSLPNCIATPHSAFNTVEAAAATNRAVVEAAIAVLSGQRPHSVLNPEVFETPQFRGREALR